MVIGVDIKILTLKTIVLKILCCLEEQFIKLFKWTTDNNSQIFVNY